MKPTGVEGSRGLPHATSPKPVRPRNVLALACLLVALLPIPLNAQGCTQCRDNTAATAPATQDAYRHAIVLMSATAAAFFLATLYILKRHR